MAGAISLTPEELRSFIPAASSIEAEIQKVSSTNDTIASTWQGQAFNAYLEQFEQLRANEANGRTPCECKPTTCCLC